MRTLTKTALRLAGAWLVATTLALVAAMLLAPSASATTGGGKVKITHTVECGEVTLTIENTTKWAFSADWKRPDDIGTPDDYSAIVVKEGPLKDQPLGNRFNAIPVPADTTASFVIELDEDESTTSVAYRLARGPEQKLFLDWVTVEVETDCQEETTTTVPTTTTPPSSEPSTPPTTDDPDTTSSEPSPSSSSVTYPPSTTQSVYYANCDAVINAGKAPIASDVPGYRLALDRDRDGIGCELEERVSNVANDRDLASTGASIGVPIALGTLLLIAGGLAVVAVRRRRSGGTT